MIHKKRLCDRTQTPIWVLSQQHINITTNVLLFELLHMSCISKGSALKWHTHVQHLIVVCKVLQKDFVWGFAL